MYSAGNAQAGSGVARTSLPVIAAICCGATLLLLLAATIVLALIPLYVPNKTLTKASTTSSQATAYFPVGDSSRKRDQGLSIADAAGYSVTDSDSLGEIKDNLFAIASQSGSADSVLLDSVSVVQLASKRRRSDGISKRQSRKTYLKCLYRIKFRDICTASSCQSTACTLIDSLFTSSSRVTATRLTKLAIIINGVRYRFPIFFSGFPRITGLRPGEQGPNNDPNVSLSPLGSNSSTTQPPTPSTPSTPSITG